MSHPEVPDYVETFRVPAAGSRDLPALDWIRRVLEGAPRPVRWALVTGWRAVLRLELGPPGAPQHVLGWRIADAAPQQVRLVAGSPLLSAALVLRVEPGALALTSAVAHRRRRARVLWALVLPVHRVMAPLLLRGAARRAAR